MYRMFQPKSNRELGRKAGRHMMHAPEFSMVREEALLINMKVPDFQSKKSFPDIGHSFLLPYVRHPSWITHGTVESNERVHDA